MTKLLSMIVAAMFAAVSVSAFAASHAGAQDKGKMEKKDDKMAKKPTAEECKKDAKMKGCEEMEKKGAAMEKKGAAMEKKGAAMEKKGAEMEKKGAAMEKKGDKMEKKDEKK